MKVLHVIHGYYPESTGGAEAYVRDLLAEQRRQGLEAALLTGSMKPWAACGVEELELEGTRALRVHRDDYHFDLHAKAYHPGIERIARDLLERERPDLVHVHQWLRLTSNLIEIAEDVGIPAVVTLHDVYTSCPRAFRVRADDEACFRELAVESCLRCVPRYGHETEAEVTEGIVLHRAQFQSELSAARVAITAAAATADLIAATTGFPRDKLTVLSLGYRRRFPGGAPKPSPLPTAGEPFRFGYWGNLTRRKGVHVLLQAFARVVPHAPRAVELHLLGGADTPDLERELRALAQGLPVFFHGRYDYAQLAAAGLHMAAFPILGFETFGFVFDEAVELGIPCIVTDLGAMPQRAGAAALAVPPRDPDALALAMARVLGRPELCDELRARFPPLPPTPEQHGQAIADLYARACAAPRLWHAPRVDPLRRAAFLLRQRETALLALHGDRGPR